MQLQRQTWERVACICGYRSTHPWETSTTAGLRAAYDAAGRHERRCPTARSQRGRGPLNRPVTLERAA